VIDILDQIARTRREVADHGTTKAVILTRAYDTSVEDLWDACTNPERLPRWFEPVSGDPPTWLRVTWEYGGDTSRVELTLREANGQVLLRLEHMVSDDEHWRTYGPGATGVGYDGSFLALALHVAGGHGAEAAEMERAFATPECTEFIRRTAAAWAGAHAASGAGRQHALATSERTVAFYTTGAESGR
jgi:hypothetical protein